MANCKVCKKGGGFLKGLIEIKGETYCSSCAEEFKNELFKKIILTTTPSVDGYRVKRYIDIESVEIVIGSGMFMEISGEVSDFFGMRSTAFEKRLQEGKKTAFGKLKYRAFERDGNAVIGIDIDYTEFSGNRIGIVVNGTVVELEPIKVQ